MEAGAIQVLGGPGAGVAALLAAHERKVNAGLGALRAFPPFDLSLLIVRGVVDERRRRVRLGLDVVLASGESVRNRRWRLTLGLPLRLGVGRVSTAAPGRGPRA